MTKQHFIALADEIRQHNKVAAVTPEINAYTKDQIECLADFCKAQNSKFKKDLWIDYVNGLCGPKGGPVK